MNPETAVGDTTQWVGGGHCATSRLICAMEREALRRDWCCRDAGGGLVCWELFFAARAASDAAIQYCCMSKSALRSFS